jgi:exoribonuclease R
LIVHRILKQVLRESNSDGSASVPRAQGRTEHPLDGSSAVETSAYVTDARPEPKRASSPQPGRRNPSTSLRTGSGAAKPSPWSKRRDHEAHRVAIQPVGGPIPLEELHHIAEESSQSERRADDAERELMEWKKVKFMQDRVGEDFDGLITSVTKFGFFVELTDLFVEGLVPLNTLIDDRYSYHENTREIIGQHSRKIYRIGQQLKVIVDRIDPVEKKINFAVLEEEAKPRSKPKSSKRRKRR